jgi:RNA binding exosome subunit
LRLANLFPGKHERSSALFEDDVARLISRNKEGHFNDLIAICEEAVQEQKATIKAARQWLTRAEAVQKERAIEEELFEQAFDLKEAMRAHSEGIVSLKDRISEALKAKA